MGWSGTRLWHTRAEKSSVRSLRAGTRSPDTKGAMTSSVAYQRTEVWDRHQPNRDRHIPPCGLGCQEPDTVSGIKLLDR